MWIDRDISQYCHGAHVKRLINIFRHAATWLSLLLCLTTMALWARSYWVHDAYPLLLTEGRNKVETWWGLILIAHCRFDRTPAHLLVHIEMANVGDHHASYTTRELITAITSCGPETIMVSAPRISFDNASVRNAFGFGHRHTHLDSMSNFGTVDFSAVAIPFWPFSLVFAVPSLLGIRQLRRDLRECRRVKRGLCQSCGYDLRASPGRCPECGVHPAEHDPA
jgi:hypothetical protein